MEFIIKVILNSKEVNSSAVAEEVISDSVAEKSLDEIEKQRFISTHLYEMLHSANSNIIKCQYKRQSNNDEYAEITMKNGCQYSINVTGDSIIAIAADVCKYMLYK